MEMNRDSLVREFLSPSADNVGQGRKVHDQAAGASGRLIRPSSCRPRSRPAASCSLAARRSAPSATGPTPWATAARSGCSTTGTRTRRWPKPQKQIRPDQGCRRPNRRTAAASWHSWLLPEQELKPRNLRLGRLRRRAQPGRSLPPHPCRHQRHADARCRRRQSGNAQTRRNLAHRRLCALVAIRGDEPAASRRNDTVHKPQL